MRMTKIVGFIAGIVLIGWMELTWASQLPVADTPECRVEFLTKEMVEHVDEAITVEEVKKTGDTPPQILRIQVNNIYPGGGFKINPKMINTGKQSVKIESVTFYPVESIQQESGQADARRLYEKLIWLDDKGNPVENKGTYGAFLTDAYEGQVIEPGETIQFPVQMMLDMEVTDLQNTATEFAIEVRFAQQTTPEGGGGGEPPVVNPPGPIDPPETIDPPEPEVDIEEEETPGGATDTPQPTDPEMEIEEEAVPGGPSQLPKTGGVLPIIFYAVGIVVLTIGIWLKKKGREE